MRIIDLNDDKELKMNSRKVDHWIESVVVRVQKSFEKIMELCTVKYFTFAETLFC